MPLRVAPAGQSLRVIRIASDDKTKKHLESLGITLDAEVEVLSPIAAMSTICKVKESRLAFDTDGLEFHFRRLNRLSRKDIKNRYGKEPEFFRHGRKRHHRLR
jgi:Fe2+ transport system protein FeoA